ncbi:MAG: hypothetical protein IKV13_05245 [Akkermansia sp.]|nr:hypothetical protein [Akkermansia sp.]
MKFHLPCPLLRLLMILAALSTAQAAVRHTDVSTMTYVDFATNSGRYVTGTTNELLDYIRQRDGGVKIYYTGGQEAYTLPHEMISFDSVSDDGNMTLIGYNYAVTVAHNNSRMEPTFGRNDYGIGEAKTIKYYAAEEYGANNTFVHHIFHSTDDYKVTRLVKLVTDASVTQMAGGASSDYKGQLVYRVGGGTQIIRDASGNISDKSSKLAYLVGGVGSITNWYQSSTDTNIRVGEVSGTTSWGDSGIGEGTPLPFGGQQGDSGSPYFVWEGDAETGGFKLLMVHRASADNQGKPENTYGGEATEWTRNVIENDSVRVDMGRIQGNLRIKGAEKADDKGGYTDTVNEVQFTISPAKVYLGDESTDYIQDKNYNAVSFNALETGQHTWKSLSNLKNTDTWYAYGSDYLNATGSVVVEGKDKVAATGPTYARLFLTQNLVLEAATDNVDYGISVTEDTDLGAGYVHFAANGQKNVRFNVSAAEGKQLDSAGYVVDAGVQVNVSMRNADSSYMREWRKVGEGTLNICGEGNNEIFLNLGGTGETLLNQTKGGYAAYNVLVNTGSTVRINDENQIYRDLTFGNGGGVLDMNGNSMDWYTSRGEERGDGFTINALTEEAVIANTKGHASLVYREESSTRFIGSLSDTKEASLAITYAGGGTWELNGIRTHLQHENSGLTVQNGTVKLAGTLTVHGYGTYHTNYGDGDEADFTTRENDWHYADATMNVTVQDKATFELESHARLTGTVTVESGGTFIMHEGVQHAEEYIEGGERLGKTADIADFYGHKGDVKLKDGAVLSWQRGSKEVASLKGVSDSGSLADVESTIASDSSLRLSAAKGKELGRIEDVALTLGDGKNLELSGVHVAAGASLYSEDGYLKVDDLTLEISSSNSKRTDQILWGDAEMISSVDGTCLTLRKGAAVLDIQSELLNGFWQVDGSFLTMDLREFELDSADAVKVYFTENVKFMDGLQVTALTQEGLLSGYYSSDSTGAVYFMVSVPEPASATLSLLALTLLSCRRRRH